MNSLKQYFNDFISLIFPNLCNACGEHLVNGENLICVKCLHQFPYTNYHLSPNNILEKQFWGRVQVNSAWAFLFFKQRSKVQKLMHQLKYNNKPDLATEMGRLYAKEITKTQNLEHYSAIIPVPIYHKKLLKRGYNQSEKIAEGLSEVLNIPVYNSVLKRIKQSDSQTSKNRLVRQENIKDSFLAFSTKESLESIILVDDTITTGATLEACIIELNKIGVKNIQIIGLAYAF